MAEALPPLGLPNHINTYSPQEVAEEVLWPLVDEFWRDNFRMTSAPGDHLSIGKGATYKGRYYSVQLVAAVEIYDDGSLDKDDEVAEGTDTKGGELNKEAEDDDIAIVHGLTLAIGKVTSGYQRDHIIAKARSAKGISKKVAKSKKIIAKTMREYYLATDNRFDVDTSQVIEDIEGEPLWSKFLDDDGDMKAKYPIKPNVKFLDLDMQQLKTGLYVLDAPKALSKRLEAIRKSPNKTKLKIKK